MFSMFKVAIKYSERWISLSVQGGGVSGVGSLNICNDVTRASLGKIGQNLLTRHFLASLPRV
jgi:hypothetical protein